MVRTCGCRLLIASIVSVESDPKASTKNEGEGKLCKLGEIRK